MNRIDDRLIHGQVMTGWLQLRNADTIWIVDDKVAQNPMMLDIFSFAAPAGISIKAFTVDEAAEELQKLDELGKKKIILIAKLPKTFSRLYELGYQPEDINYGAMANKSTDIKATVEVASNCSLTPEDIEETEKLYEKGVHIWIQLVPFGGQKVTEWADARKNAGLS